MSTEKQFIGRVQQVTTKYGPLTKVGISEADFKKHQVNGWVNFIVKTSKEGKVYLEVDNWKPDGKNRPVIENTNPLPSHKLSTEQEWSDKVNGNDGSLPF